MLDDFDALSALDTSGFLSQLAALPGSYDGPDGVQPGPYGVLGFGEGAVLAGLLASWTEGPMVGAGTQFVLASGFDFGEAAALRLTAELAGARQPSPVQAADAAGQDLSGRAGQGGNVARP